MIEDLVRLMLEPDAKDLETTDRRWPHGGNLSCGNGCGRCGHRTDPARSRSERLSGIFRIQRDRTSESPALQENLLDHEINDYDLIYFDYTPRGRSGKLSPKSAHKNGKKP